MTRLPIAPADVAEGTMRGLRLDTGRYLLLVRLGGRLHALDDCCNHAGCLLSRGRLDAGRVVCPCHLMAFDVATGTLATTPRLCEDQRTWPVEERDGGIWVALPVAG
jgi:3-phenylpropionate/trans-cinnamate dioxygenase ferredoxin subunit